MMLAATAIRGAARTAAVAHSVKAFSTKAATAAAVEPLVVPVELVSDTL